MAAGTTRRTPFCTRELKRARLATRVRAFALPTLLPSLVLFANSCSAAADRLTRVEVYLMWGVGIAIQLANGAANILSARAQRHIDQTMTPPIQGKEIGKRPLP